MVTFPLHSRNSWSCVLYLRLLRYSFFSIKTCFFKFLISYLHFSFFFLTIKFSWLAHSIPRRQGGLIHILGFSKICPLFFSFFLFLFWILNFFSILLTFIANCVTNWKHLIVLACYLFISHGASAVLKSWSTTFPIKLLEFVFTFSSHVWPLLVSPWQLYLGVSGRNVDILKHTCNPGECDHFQLRFFSGIML